MRYIGVVITCLFMAAMIVVGVGVMEPTSAQAASGGYVAKCGGGKIFLNSKERATFLLHNKIRRNHGLKPFCVHPNLEKAARAHSKDMIQRDYFSHDTKGGGTFEQRLKNYGYTPSGYSYYLVGENIAWGSGSYGTPDYIVSQWMHSTEHRHNILNGKFRQIGIGTYNGTFQGYQNATMYTTDFGTRR